jgi:hypothetical protein
MMQLSACLGPHADGFSASMPTPVPPGTPWMADPVVAAWQEEDPDKTRAVAAGLHDLLAAESRALRALGVELKDLGIGLLAFPSFLDGAKEVRLCWQLGEAEIRHYRSPSAAFHARRSIDGHRFTSQRGAPDNLVE